MKIIKRSGEEVRFSAAKIIRAIQQANTSVSPDEALPKEMAKAIAGDIQRELSASSTPHSVEDIQDRVVVGIMKAGKFQLAKLAKSFPDTTATLTKGEKTVKLSQLMILMGLAVKKDTEVTVAVEGAAEEEAYKALLEFFEQNL